MPSENGRRAIAIRIEPIWTTVMPRFSTSMNPSGSRFARSRISCARARSSILAGRLLADLHEFHVVYRALLCRRADPFLEVHRYRVFIEELVDTEGDKVAHLGF